MIPHLRQVFDTVHTVRMIPSSSRSLPFVIPQGVSSSPAGGKLRLGFIRMATLTPLESTVGGQGRSKLSSLNRAIGGRNCCIEIAHARPGRLTGGFSAVLTRHGWGHGPASPLDLAPHEARMHCSGGEKCSISALRRNLAGTSRRSSGAAPAAGESRTSMRNEARSGNYSEHGISLIEVCGSKLGEIRWTAAYVLGRRKQSPVF